MSNGIKWTSVCLWKTEGFTVVWIKWKCIQTCTTAKKSSTKNKLVPRGNLHQSLTYVIGNQELLRAILNICVQPYRSKGKENTALLGLFWCLLTASWADILSLPFQEDDDILVNCTTGYIRNERSSSLKTLQITTAWERSERTSQFLGYCKAGSSSQKKFVLFSLGHVTLD